MSDNPKRRWYQFNLLALFVLTTLVAAVLAYITYEQRLARNQKSATEELEKLDGVRFRLFMEGTQRGPWLQLVLGDDTFDRFPALDFKHGQAIDKDQLSAAELATAVGRLRNFRHLKFVQFGPVELDDVDLANLRGLTELEKLSISSSRITGAGLRTFRNFLRLKEAELRGCEGITDSGLENLGQLKNLEIVGLEGTQVTDAGLAYFRDLQTLQSVNLSRTKVTDAGLPHLLQSRGMKRLYLLGLPITDDGLALIGEFSNLEILYGGPKITDAGLAHLRGLTRLKTLNLHGNQVRGDGLVHLKGLSQLTFLGLPETKVGDDDVETLASLRALTFLDLRKTNLSPEGLARLRKSLPKCTIVSE